MAEHLAHHGKEFNAKYIFNNFVENPETGEHTATAFLSPEHLAGEGLSPVFVEYMRNWRHFVADAS